MLISAVATRLGEAEERASTGAMVLLFVGFLFAVTCLVVMT
jgi:hypothetical protein